MTSKIIIKKFDDFDVGHEETMTVETSDELVRHFAKLTTDENPLHVNEEFAKNSMFGRRLVHGAFSSGLISAVIGMKLPGPGALYLDQYSKFVKPVFIGDTITATVKVLEKKVKEREGKPPMNLLILETIVRNQDNKVVTDGKATVLVQNM